MATRRPEHIDVENIIKGLRFIFSMRSGPKNDVAKLRHPAPKLAKVAVSKASPAF